VVALHGGHGADAGIAVGAVVAPTLVPLVELAARDDELGLEDVFLRVTKGETQ